MSEKKFFDETPQRLQGYADKWLADPKVKKAIHRSLDDLLSGATDNNQHPEIGTGCAVGNEFPNKP
jgi:hypothetical protein